MLMTSALVVAMLATAAAPADALAQATSTTAMLNQFASSRLQELNLDAGDAAERCGVSELRRAHHGGEGLRRQVRVPR
jgi:hypothetical protein